MGCSPNPNPNPRLQDITAQSKCLPFRKPRCSSSQSQPRTLCQQGISYDQVRAQTRARSITLGSKTSQHTGKASHPANLHDLVTIVNLELYAKLESRTTGVRARKTTPNPNPRLQDITAKSQGLPSQKPRYPSNRCQQRTLCQQGISYDRARAQTRARYFNPNGKTTISNPRLQDITAHRQGDRGNLRRTSSRISHSSSSIECTALSAEYLGSYRPFLPFCQWSNFAKTHQWTFLPI